MSVATENDVFSDLMSEVDSSQPCQADDVILEEGNCPEQAEWVVFWKPVCGGGQPVAGAMANTLCTKHKEILLLSLRDRSIYCDGCGQKWEHPSHIVKSIEAL